MTDGSPGWFRDPTDASLARWHDGERWTEHTLVIADQTPGVEPEPPDLGPDTVATPIVASEPEFHIPRPARGMSGSWPTWAKVGAPIAVLVLALGAWVLTSGGDDDPDDTATVDTIPASLEDAVDAARQAGLPDEVSDSRAAALIERICAATTRPTAKEQLGEDLGELPAESASELRRTVGALGVGAALRCRDDLEAAPDLIDDLQDLAVTAFASRTTAPTVLPPDGGTDAGLEAAGTDGGTGDGTDGGTTRTTRRSSTATTARPPTTTTTKPLPQVLPNTACSTEGAKAQNKITGAGLTCQKKCNSSGLQWRSGPCPTTPTAPPATGPPPTFPTTGGTTTGGDTTTGGSTTGPVTGG